MPTRFVPTFSTSARTTSKPWPARPARCGRPASSIDRFRSTPSSCGCSRKIRSGRAGFSIFAKSGFLHCARQQRAAPVASASGVPHDAVFVLPQRSWSGFTSEFVKEHWQKLILSLAVLLIVVSSTVGAHILLGDLLWSPEGKCTLALAGTLLLAGLGAGLDHWGAGRAGRMMLVTTLIVVPIHFMLAGELRLLLQPPSLRLAFLGAIAVVLVVLVRWTSGRLAEPRGAWLLTASLLLISLGSAATTRGSPIAWALQFACFQFAPLVFLATVFAMGTRQWGRSEEEHREYVYTMFGVLGFALFSCLLRRCLCTAAAPGAVRHAGDAGRDFDRARCALARPVRARQEARGPL